MGSGAVGADGPNRTHLSTAPATARPTLPDGRFSGVTDRGSAAVARAALAARPVVRGGEHEEPGLGVGVPRLAGGDRGAVASEHLGPARDREPLGVPARVGGLVHRSTLAPVRPPVRRGVRTGDPGRRAARDRPYPSRPMTLAERIRGTRPHRRRTPGRRPDPRRSEPPRLRVGGRRSRPTRASGTRPSCGSRSKLGFGGFSELQAAARERDGRPAPPGDASHPPAPGRRPGRPCTRHRAGEPAGDVRPPRPAASPPPRPRARARAGASP